MSDAGSVSLNSTPILSSSEGKSFSSFEGVRPSSKFNRSSIPVSGISPVNSLTSGISAVAVFSVSLLTGMLSDKISSTEASSEISGILSKLFISS